MKERVTAIGLACAAFIILASTRVSSDVLPAGQHTVSPKFWPKSGWHVTNFTPYQFDRAIRALTPGVNNDLWFSVGSSLEHIDANRTMTTIPMPHAEWVVSGIAIAEHEIWFTTGQSGKVGILSSNGAVRYLQVVPRHVNPDLREVVVNGRGEMWFVDFGRSSIGYRSASGRVVENPFANGDIPLRMIHCMGKLWVLTSGESGVKLNVIDENLKPQPQFLGPNRGSFTGDVACDSSERIWISRTNTDATWIDRLDQTGNFKQIRLPELAGGRITGDSAAGIWMTGAVRQVFRVQLTHVDTLGAVTSVTLPSEIEGDNEIVSDRGRLWLAINDGESPVAVTELEP